MNEQSSTSKYIDEVVNEFSKLPGIGKKTALRFALHLLRKNKDQSEKLGNAIINLSNNAKYCSTCYNISDTDVCNICSSESRDKSIICIVQDIKDIMAIENTGHFKGVYHVLGGLISPMDGVGPKDLNIEPMVERVANKEVIEIIIALSATMEGDTTAFYIFKKLKDVEVLISSIARGVAIGDELEYTDELTLGKSILNRVKYESAVAR